MQFDKNVIAGTGVTVAVVAVLVYFFWPSAQGPERIVDGCTRPAELAAVDDRTLKLAAAQIGKIAVGDLTLRQDSEVVQLLGSNEKKLLVFDYLMCEAKARGELDPTDAAQTERIRMVTGFLSTSPTAAEFIEWYKLTTKPVARFVVPELLEEDTKKVLVLAEAVGHLSLTNAGETEINAWVGNLSPGKLMVKPRSVTTLQKTQHVEVEVGLLAPASSGPWRLRVGSSALADDYQVEVRLADADAFAALAEDVASELQNKVSEAPADSSPVKASDQAPAETATGPGAQWLATSTHDVVRRKYPGTSEELVWAITGSLLEQMNWNGPAVVAYRRSRALLGEAAVELEIPLSRAQVLANVAADPARNERPPSQVLRDQDADLERLASLDLAKRNVLVSARPDVAQRLATTLASQPALNPFALGLKGDVAIATDPQAAVEAYDGCARTSGTPSCSLRKAEAQVALQEVQAAKVTLSNVATQAPVAERAVTSNIASRATDVANQARFIATQPGQPRPEG